MSGKILAAVCQNPGHIMVRCAQNSGNIPAKYWQNPGKSAGKILAKSWQGWQNPSRILKIMANHGKNSRKSCPNLSELLRARASALLCASVRFPGVLFVFHVCSVCIFRFRVCARPSCSATRPIWAHICVRILSELFFEISRSIKIIKLHVFYCYYYN